MFFLLFVLLAGCEHPCRKNVIHPAFIHFQIEDIDTIILRAYRPNNNYLQLVDTFLVHNLHASIYTTVNDTTIVYVNNSDPDHWVSAGFDWQIYIPTKNRTISVAGIESEQVEGNKRCINPVTAFVQDGQRVVPENVNTGQWQTSGYRAYIRN